MKVHLNFTFYTFSLILGTFIALNENHAFSVNGESIARFRDASGGLASLSPNGKDDPKVSIPGLGVIQGGVNFTFPLFTVTTRPFYFFAGIPYADPKSYTKDNRFKPSEIWKGNLPVDDTGVFLATDHSIRCPQSGSSRDLRDYAEVLNYHSNVGSASGGIIQKEEHTEECLVLNIDTPDLPLSANEPVNALLPVIVFLHGGSFDSGWSGLYRGHRFLKNDVLFVSINYRLGLLGSLNLGTNDAPGNAALYDLITALKWIKTYIHHFSGDKDKITVAGRQTQIKAVVLHNTTCIVHFWGMLRSKSKNGHSAGAVLATHLLTSQLDIDDDDGLPSVQGIIGLSGSSLSQTLSTCTEPLAHHLRVSQLAGCHDGANGTPNVEEIRNCMVQKTPSQLLDAMNQYTSSEISEGRFGLDAKLPSLQSKSIVKAFMTETPYQVLSEGKQKLNIPVMMGATRHDGSYLVEQTLERFWRPHNFTNDPLYLRNDLLPALLNAFGLKDDSMEFIHSLENLYFGDAVYADDFESKIPGLIDVFSVLAFKAGAYNLVELNAKKNQNSYYFSFEYRGVCSMSNGQAIPGGVGHTDSLFYLFPTKSCLMALPWDISFSNQFINYWVNFATNGNPNVKGPKTIVAPYNPLNHAYAIIDGFDRTAYYCRDAWIKNSLELIKEKPSPSTTEPTEPTSETETSVTESDLPTTSTSIKPTVPDDNSSATTVHLNAALLFCILVCVFVQN